MRLVERGQVSLDDPVVWYLPEFAGADRAAVRVRDLLTGEVFSWQGSRHYVRLDPAGVPAHVLVPAT